MADMRAEAVKRLVDRHGSYRAAAAVIGIPHSYLHKIGARLKYPSQWVAHKLGLRKVVHYEWVETITKPKK